MTLCVILLLTLNTSFGQKKKDKKPSEWYNESFKFKNDSILMYGETVVKNGYTFCSGTRIGKGTNKFVHIFLSWDLATSRYYRIISVIDRTTLKELFQLEIKPLHDKEFLQKILIEDDKMYVIFKDYKKIKGKENKKNTSFV